MGDYTRFSLPGSGVIGSYIHFNNKLGVLVEIEASSDDVATACQTVATDIAMHVTAMNPVAHPMGGGEGRTKGGRHPCSPSSVPAKGGRTRKKNNPTNRFILRSRHKR